MYDVVIVYATNRWLLKYKVMLYESYIQSVYSSLCAMFLSLLTKVYPTIILCSLCGGLTWGYMEQLGGNSTALTSIASVQPSTPGR